MTAHELPRKVVILGLGLFGGGVGAARYFAEKGSHVVVSDCRPEDALSESVDALRGLPVEYRLGAHDADHFADADCVIINPAIAPDSAAFQMARRSGALLETEINLLLRLCPAPVAAITGTNGKSTTVALLGEMMRATGRRTWVGGNLGGSLLPCVEHMTPADAVVLEISSFQAERLAWVRRSPHIVAVLNMTPNHLDRHQDMGEYAQAKQQLLRYQTTSDFAMLNAQDAIVRTWMNIGHGQKFLIGVPESARCGAHIRQDSVQLWSEHSSQNVSLRKLRLRGPHNCFNAACAATAAWLFGADGHSIEAGLAKFNGLPDRLEFVAEKNGVRFYNDSIATTPESTLAALASFKKPVLLIAGGSSKNLSFDEMGKQVAQRTRQVILMGATAQEIETAIRASGEGCPPLHRVDCLEDAVQTAFRFARHGDIVLLSPGCASFDMFRNYAERGQRFRKIVLSL